MGIFVVYLSFFHTPPKTTVTQGTKLTHTIPTYSKSHDSWTYNHLYPHTTHSFLIHTWIHKLTHTHTHTHTPIQTHPYTYIHILTNINYHAHTDIDLFCREIVKFGREIVKFGRFSRVNFTGKESFPRL